MTPEARFNRLRAMSPEQRAWLFTQLAHQTRGQGKVASGRIPRRSQSGPVPLSYAQQRMWFLSFLDPRAGAHTFAAAFRIAGALDMTRLRSAFDVLIRRHEILRTTFPVIGGQPVQKISPTPAAALRTIDVQVADELSLQTHIAAATATKFLLDQGPLLTITLLRMSAMDHALVVAMPYIICDTWSIALMVQECMIVYEGFSSGHPAYLPALPIQYADYAAWEQSLPPEAYAKSLAYWRTQLAGAPAVLTLPPDPECGESTSLPYAGRYAIALQTELVAQLRSLARDGEGTLFMVLLVLFALVLQHHTGSTDVIIGTDVANRDRVETEKLFGFMVNQLVLRIKLSGKPTFSDLLAQARTVTLGAFAHQDVPFQKLVEEFVPRRDLRVSPMFQIKFVLQNIAMPIVSVAGLTITPLPIEVGAAQFDLTLNLFETEHGLNGALEYRTDRYLPTTVSRVASEFLTLARAVATNPLVKLDELHGLLKGAEQRKENVEVSASSSSPNSQRKFAPGARKAISPYQSELVRMDLLFPERSLPIVIQPAVKGVDLLDWIQSNREKLNSDLLTYGALLFRGFTGTGMHTFEEVVKAFSGELLEYRFRASPRSEVGNRIYTSTDYPPEESIFPHNEHSYSPVFPLKIFFYCETPAQAGGETPIGDVRRVLARISPATRDRFLERNILYVRNYGDGFGLPWQTVFQTEDRTEVERYCTDHNIITEWKDGNRLRTRQVGPAMLRHPRTNEHIWFNHAAFFHVTTLTPAMSAALQTTFAPDDLPNNTFYGDGSPIEPEILDELRAAYTAEMVDVLWREGDILVLDNMLAVHARKPYVPPRKVVVAMAEPYASSDLRIR